MIDAKKMTRARAENLAAKTTDEETLQALKQHANKHVVHKATHKLARIQSAAERDFGAA